MTPVLPEGVRVGHWTDADAWTGCTVCLLPEGSVASCEVRGGAPGTLASDILQPAAAGPGAHAILLTGGSAFGLAAADGVVRWLEEHGVGFPTAAALVPLVGAAVVYDLGLGASDVRPTADAGYAASESASLEVERGSVGVGTGCTVGKLLGAEHWTKGGFGFASEVLTDGVTVAALAAVNAVGDVLADDGTILAGMWRDGAYVASAAVLARGESVRRSWRESTTLVCIVTDAVLTKLEAWMCARAANAGVARAISPVWTPFDGDTVFCASTRAVEADVVAVAAASAAVAAEAVRDGARSATGAPGCPAAAER